MPKYQVAKREKGAMRFLTLTGERKRDRRAVVSSDRCVFFSDFTVSSVNSAVFHSDMTQVSMLEDVPEKLADVQAIRDSNDMYEEHKKHKLLGNKKHKLLGNEKHKLLGNKKHKLLGNKKHNIFGNKKVKQSDVKLENVHHEKLGSNSDEKSGSHIHGESLSHYEYEGHCHEKTESHSHKGESHSRCEYEGHCHDKSESHSNEKGESQSHDKSENHSIESIEKPENPSHENDDSHSLEKLESRRHENGKIKSYEKPKSHSYNDKTVNASHENGKMESSNHDKIENDEMLEKNKDNFQLKGPKKCCKKCKSHKRSDNKQKTNSPCEIHKSSPEKHKRRSSTNEYQMKRRGGHCIYEKVGNHHVYTKSMSKTSVLFVVPVKQRCPRSLKRKVVEICSCKKSHKRLRKNRKIPTIGYTVPSHTRVTKKSKKRMMYNYRKNGKSVEVRIKKEDRHTHEQLRKTIFGHTSRTINKIIHADQDKRTKKVTNVMKGKIRSKAGKKRKTCESKKQEVQDVKVVDHGNLSICWLCDRIDKCGTRKMQCDKCCVWFHTSC
ncbi:uncharacterized protein LOC117299455 isoform X2 [Asterias rubens]|nr:uncharacterized protein LOC117299455 isoform X2 [Asterias rubens]